MRKTDLLTIGEVSRRSGLTVTTIRHYEALGLVACRRTPGGHRLFERAVLRRLAVVRAGQEAGLSLEAVRASMAFLDPRAAPTRAQWRRISSAWRPHLDARIARLVAVRDNLDSCIGCGCLSMRQCTLYNPADALAATGSGARRLFPTPEP